jgi:glycosyltransferase involved in cell wall biosynthesis
MAPSLGTVAKRLRKKNIKVIAITDNVIPHEKRPGDASFTKYFVNQCDGFVTMSRSVYDDLSKFTSTTKKTFLPHPIYNIFGEKVPKHVARKNLNLIAEDKIILFFGFIRPYKGLNLLIDAMSDQRLRERKVKLLIAGEFYEEKTPYLDKIKNNNLSDVIILHTDFIEKSKVRDYFSAADLIVQPYLTATQSGITQIAYYFGRPMLVTNVGGLAEIVSNKRVGYVTDKSSVSIADAICDYYDNDREDEFAKNVLIDKEKFSWKNFIAGIKKLYDEL